jgi:hypothetical protein
MDALFWMSFFIYILPLASFYYRLMVLTLNAFLIIFYLVAEVSLGSGRKRLAMCGRFSEFFRSRTDIDLRNRNFSPEAGELRTGRRAQTRWSSCMGQTAMVALIR